MSTNPADRLAAFVSRIGAVNSVTIGEAARVVRAALTAGGLVHVAGAGHSLNAVTEAFFRAGGLALVKPLWHPRIYPLNSATGSTAAEREPGLGAQVITAADPGPDDVVFIFSNSGINPYPIEIAQGARERGTPVVAVTSLVASQAAPLRAGARLYELADVVLDTLVPPGDVSWPEEAPVTAPLSSLANVTVWTLLMQTLVDDDPGTLLWQSANVAGTDEINARTREILAGRVAEI